jgi:DNA-binding NarL/FixJ family response regulator
MASRNKRKKCDTTCTPQTHSYAKRSTQSVALGLGRPAPLKATLRGHSAEAQAIRILVADDHPIFRYGLRELLSTQMDFMLVGEATTGDEVFRLINDLKPDILLLDLSMPGMSGMDVLRRLRDQRDVRAIVLTASITPSETAQVLKLGGQGIVLKGSPSSALFKSIRSVFEGQIWLGRQDVAGVVEVLADAQHPDREQPALRLTARERDVLEELVAGAASNREIAQKLSISVDTVKHHLTNIFDKTGVASRVELALYAIQHQLVNYQFRSSEVGPHFK